MTKELSILRTNVAYKSGMSVHDIIRNLLNNLNIAKKKKISYITYLIDFSATFDSISHNYFFEVLSFIGFPNQFIDQFRVSFSNLKALLKGYLDIGDIPATATLEDIEIPIQSGVQQGSSKSGILFVFLLAPLLVMLNSINTLKPLTVTTHDRSTDLQNIMGYSDDLTIDGEVQIDDDWTCPQIE